MKTKRMKVSNLKTDSTLRSPILPDGFIERVQKYKSILAEVERTSLEETILNFQKDLYPERELEAWGLITSKYQDFTNANPELTLEDKRKAFRILVSSSMGIKIKS